MPRDDDDGTSLGEGEVIQSTDLALRVSLETGDTIWIPIKCIHDNSEVYDAGENSTGDVVVQTWWAEKEGLA